MTKKGKTGKSYFFKIKNLKINKLALMGVKI